MFWTVCIPVRLSLAHYALSKPILLRMFALCVSIVYLSGTLNEKDKGFFGGHVWWAKERQMHGVLWGLYAATQDVTYMLLDVLLGVCNWLSKEFYLGQSPHLGVCPHVLIPEPQKKCS